MDGNALAQHPLVHVALQGLEVTILTPLTLQLGVHSSYLFVGKPEWEQH